MRRTNRFNYPFLLLVNIILHFSRQTEIGYLDDSVIGQKNISGGQIAV
jgi:hypothetical protein